jgi:hypothetical protein
MEVGAIGALRQIHEELWDDVAGAVRLAPGVTPGVDLSALGLHSVRETALGALLDLGDGRVERAVRALERVLGAQYPLVDQPWSGTFPVTFEQRRPPDVGAVEWVDYDPNWRQFLGCILALCAIHHGNEIPDSVVTRIDDALVRCVDGEPDARIASWYTNPLLMHVWLLGHVGVRTGSRERVDASRRRVERVAARFERLGDVDEYNSPTYDGVDLFALGLWEHHPPTPLHREVAETMLAGIGARIGALFHPDLGLMCGPFIRAYGVDLRTYVSLIGLWLDDGGASREPVLPAPLDQHTDHVHDLYFLPAFQHLAPVIRHVSVRDVPAERVHEQRFGDACATSLLRPDLAVGWERGRRHEFSLDQYVPFSAHTAESSGGVTAVGVMPFAGTAAIDVERVGDLEFVVRASGDDVGLRIVGAGPSDVVDDTVRVGRVTMRLEPPDRVSGERDLRCEWSSSRTVAHISITP